MTRVGPRRGDVFAVRLGRVEGSEQAGTRPAIVVSNDGFNARLPLVTVVPLTTRRKGRRIYPSEAPVPAGSGGIRAESVALGHQVRTISTARLGRLLGQVDDATSAALDGALRTHFELNQP